MTDATIQKMLAFMTPTLWYALLVVMALVAAFLIYLLVKPRRRTTKPLPVMVKTVVTPVKVAVKADLTPREAFELLREKHPEMSFKFEDEDEKPKSTQLDANEEADRQLKIKAIRDKLDRILGTIGYYKPPEEKEEDSHNGHRASAKSERDDKLNTRLDLSQKLYDTPTERLAELTYIARRETFEFALMETFYVADLIAQLEVLGVENTEIWLPTVYRCSIYRHRRSVDGMQLMKLGAHMDTAMAISEEDPESAEMNRG